MVYSENDFLRIEINTHPKLMYSVWLRNVTDDEFRTGITLMKKVITEHQIQYWISDTKMDTAMPFTQQQCIVKELAPFILRSSKVKKVAQIGSTDLFDYMAYDSIAKRTQEQHGAIVEFEQFSSREAALYWVYLS